MTPLEEQFAYFAKHLSIHTWDHFLQRATDLEREYPDMAGLTQMLKDEKKRRQALNGSKASTPAPPSTGTQKEGKDE